MLILESRHFGHKTLRTQDISVPKFESEVSGHFGLGAEVSRGHFGTGSGQFEPVIVMVQVMTGNHLSCQSLKLVQVFEQ